MNSWKRPLFGKAIGVKARAGASTELGARLGVERLIAGLFQ